MYPILVQSGLSKGFKYSKSDGLYIWEVLLAPVFQSGLKCNITVRQEATVKYLRNLVFGDIWMCTGKELEIYSVTLFLPQFPKTTTALVAELGSELYIMALEHEIMPRSSARCLS